MAANKRFWVDPERHVATCVAFLLFFLAIPVRQLGIEIDSGIPLMPGDVGDARLNNYFLENVFLFLQGKSESVWHLGFFAPFPYVLGFSDNLFGTSPIYVAFRTLSFDPSTAFQLWHLSGYLLNYAASYYSLRKLGASSSAATLGAVVFTFSIPVTAHAGHAQLHHRFCVPLAFLYFFHFIDHKSLKALTISLFWLVWQFYCGVYIGFFTGMLLVAMGFGAFIHAKVPIRAATAKFTAKITTSWLSLPQREKASLVVYWALLLSLLVLLFYPYLQVSKLYGVKRNWSEISEMLPRLQSYLIADRSLYWTMPQGGFFQVPMRHEHQMFPGLVCAVLFVSAITQAPQLFRAPNKAFAWSLLAIALIVAVTLCFDRFSLWYVFHWLPLASAIRAMSRIDLILLMPAAVVIAFGFDHIQSRTLKIGRGLILVALAGLLFDFSATSMYTSPKSVWEQQAREKLSQIPKGISKDSILFFSSTTANDWSFNPEIDAMWAGMMSGHKVMNGYSGGHPQNSAFGYQYAFDCSVIPQRIAAYAHFSRDRLNREVDYKALMAKIVPVGFLGCEPEWLKTMPTISTADRIYTREEFGRLRLRYHAVIRDGGRALLEFEIVNSSNTSFAANSAMNRPIRVSWRHLDAGCQPSTGWIQRKNLPFDIPANGSVRMRIALDARDLDEGCGVEVSIVQELEFWGHDIGIAPLLVKCGAKAGLKHAC